MLELWRGRLDKIGRPDYVKSMLERYGDSFPPIGSMDLKMDFEDIVFWCDRDLIVCETDISSTQTEMDEYEELKLTMSAGRTQSGSKSNHR